MGLSQPWDFIVVEEHTLRQAFWSHVKEERRAFVARLMGGIPDAPLELSWEQIAAIDDDAPLHCADDAAQQRMIELIDETRKQGEHPQDAGQFARHTARR